MLKREWSLIVAALKLYEVTSREFGGRQIPVPSGENEWVGIADECVELLKKLPPEEPATPPKLVLTRPDGPLFNGLSVECDFCRPQHRIILTLADDGTAYCQHESP